MLPPPPASSQSFFVDASATSKNRVFKSKQFLQARSVVRSKSVRHKWACTAGGLRSWRRCHSFEEPNSHLRRRVPPSPSWRVIAGKAYPFAANIRWQCGVVRLSVGWLMAARLYSTSRFTESPCSKSCARKVTGEVPGNAARLWLRLESLPPHPAVRASNEMELA